MKTETAGSANHATHTAGPWEVSSGEINARYIRGIGDVVLIRRNGENDNRYVAFASIDAMGDEWPHPVKTTREEQRANARLIASAPDLLAALKAILAHPRTDNRSIVFMPGDVALAEAAIAKATRATP